jgi:beta-phosphoglucomutase
MLQKKFSAFLFDMDGLLMDTERVHILAYMRLTERLGRPQSFEALTAFIGHSHHVTCKWLVDEVGFKQPTSELIAAEQAIYFEILRELNPQPLPGVRELFDFGDSLKIKRALVSSSEANQVEPTMTILGAHLKRDAWKEHFHAICTGDRVKKLKPAPDLYLLATKELELEPSRCIAFEDSTAGISAARAAGCYVVAVPNLHLKGRDVAQGKADHVCETLNDAFELLKNLQ